MATSNTEKVIRGISSQTVVTFVTGIVEIASFSIMSRLLTQDDFGYYAAITAITTIFSSFSETGIGSAIVQKKDISQTFVNNAFTLNLIFGSFISLLLLCLATPISNIVIDSSMKKPLMIMSITLFCNCLTSVSTSIMERNLQFLRIGAINLVSLIITTIVAIVLALRGLGYYSILAKAVLSSVLSLILSYAFVNCKFKVELNKDTSKQIFGFSGWLMASVFFRNFAQQADKLLMGRLLSVTALGTYNRPKEFINQISSKLNGIFDTALFPVLSSIQDKRESMANAYKTSLYYLNVFSIIIMMGFIFNSELIIRIFLGEQWMSVKTLFIILSFALLFNIDGRLVDCYFRSLGLTKAQFYFRILELFIKVVSLIIGANWNIVGVAVAVVLANLLMIIIKVLFLSSRIFVSNIETAKMILSAWECAILFVPVMMAAGYIMPHSWVGSIGVLCIYIITILLAFLFCPRLVGAKYKKEAYPKITSFVKQKFHII